VNEHGLLAAVLNRRIRNGQKPPPNPRSRGLLCLDVLKLKTAAEAWGVLHDFEDRYQPFTLVFADTTQAFFAYNTHREIKMGGLKQGLHGFSNTGEFEVQSEKVSRAYGQLASLADEIRSKASDASSWLQPFSKVLGDHAAGNDSNDPREAICVHGNESGTVSSSIIVYSRSNQQCQTFYCPGPPCRESFGEPVALRLR
jgi:uncharacterized protein with NRDE domain